MPWRVQSVRSRREGHMRLIQVLLGAILLMQIYAMVQDLDRLLSIEEEIGRIQGITKVDVELRRFGEKWTKWPSPRQYISTF